MMHAPPQAMHRVAPPARSREGAKTTPALRSSAPRQRVAGGRSQRPTTLAAQGGNSEGFVDW